MATQRKPKAPPATPELKAEIAAARAAGETAEALAARYNVAVSAVRRYITEHHTGAERVYQRRYDQPEAEACPVQYHFEAWVRTHQPGARP